MPSGLDSITGAASTWSTLSDDASSGLQRAQNLGAAALSCAESLGRQGMDLGRTLVAKTGALGVKGIGDAATSAIGRAQTAAENRIRQGVMGAGKAVHQAADQVRGDIQGNGVIARGARSVVDNVELNTRTGLGLVGGVAKGAVSLAGSASQLSVMAAEYQLSPAARTAVDAKMATSVGNGVKAVGGYALKVAADPSRLPQDLAQTATSTFKAGVNFGRSEVASAKQAVAEGHGPESLGLNVGEGLTYLVPVGGEARVAVEGGEIATRAVVGTVVDDGVRATVKDGAEAVAGGARAATSTGGASAVIGVTDVAKRTGASEGRLQQVLDTAKGLRPPPAEYLSPERISEHRAAFDQGASRFSLRSSVDKYGIAQRDGTTFVMTRSGADDLLKAAGDDPRALERALGLPKGQLEGAELVRVDFKAEAMKDLHVRMPTGNEAGANEHWLPGGLLPSGKEEAVLDGAQAKIGQYSIAHVR